VKKYKLLLLIILVSKIACAQLNVQYYLNQGRRHLQEEKYREAIPFLNTAITAKPTEPEGYFLRAYAKYLLGDLLGAEEDLNKTINLKPNALRAYDLRGIIRINLDKFQLAQLDFANAHALQPSNPNYLIYEGYCHMEIKNFASALDRLNKAMELVSDNPKAYYFRGIVHSNQQDTAKAIADYSKTVQLQPDYVEAYMNRGILYFNNEDYQEAIADYDKVIHIEPLNEQAYINRGLAYYRDGSFDNALANLDTAIVLNKQNALAYFNRALVKNHIGLHNQAITDLDALAKIQPNNLLTYFNRGIIKMEIDDLRGAFLDFSKCIDLFPDFAKAYLNRAFVRSELKDRQGAMLDRQKAREIAARYKEYENGNINYADTSASFQRLMAFQTNESFNDQFARKKTIKPITILRLNKTNGTKKEIKSEYDYQLLKKLETVFNKGYEFTTVSNSGVAIQPDNTLNRLLIARDNNYFNSAEAMVDSLMQTNEKPAWLYWFIRGNTRYLMAQQVKSIEENDNFRLSGSNSPSVNYNLQQEVTYQGWEDARKDYQKALNLNPEIPYVWFNMGNAYLQERSYRKAIQSYSQAIRIHEGFHQALFNRGLTYIYLKQTQNGCMDMSKAGELGNKSAYEVIQRYCE